MINIKYYNEHMPEGDAILYNVCFLNKEIKNYTLETITNIHNCNGVIKKIDCKGKLLYMSVNDFFIHVHFGLTGYLDFEPHNEKYEIKVSKDSKNKTIYLNDNINLSSITKHSKDEHDEILNKLGVSIFDKDFTFDYFKECFNKKKNLLCSFLMNQSCFSGVGNYIKNEVIYLSKLDIRVKVNALSDSDKQNLYDNILHVAYSSLFEHLEKHKLLSHLENKYEKNKPDNLQIPYKLKIYKKEKIGDKVVKHVKIAGRETYYI